MATIFEDRLQGYCIGAKVYDHESSSLDSIIIRNTSLKSRYVFNFILSYIFISYRNIISVFVY